MPIDLVKPVIDAVSQANASARPRPKPRTPELEADALENAERRELSSGGDSAGARDATDGLARAVTPDAPGPPTP